MLPAKLLFASKMATRNVIQRATFTQLSTFKPSFLTPKCTIPTQLPTKVTGTWSMGLQRRFQSTTTELTWQEYFNLRKEKRNYERFFGVLSTMGAFLGGSFYFGTVAPFDPTVLYFGMLDQTFIYAGATILVTIAGWFLGQGFGSMVWRLRRSGIQKAVDVKDKSFFHRIAKNRVVPRSQAVNRAVPDYYGEKIFSVPEYRKWLKSQRAYDRLTEFKVFK